ncbi:MAG: hypothetical protein M0R51_08035 [Clostridia bacterium]|jgi:hypothetical protein|nr:hypothetical protein [Clostridia bacterium]
MTHKNRQLLDEYVLRLSDLQYKKRKKQEDFIIIGLFLIAFVEYLSNKNIVFTGITSEKELEKPKKMVELIDKGLNNQGKFVNYVKDMRESNVNIINTTTNIIPQIKEKSESIAKKKLIETIEKTDLYEKQNYLSQFINNTAFNKNYKTWNTQRDNRVRYTTFHQNIDGIEVKINEFFNVDGITAMFPAHSTLPQYDRINCRCYLTYR